MKQLSNGDDRCITVTSRPGFQGIWKPGGRTCVRVPRYLRQKGDLRKFGHVDPCVWTLRLGGVENPKPFTTVHLTGLKFW